MTYTKIHQDYSYNSYSHDYIVAVVMFNSLEKFHLLFFALRKS